MHDLLDAAGGVLDDVVALRRRIHAEPELGLTLPKTQAAVVDALDGLGLDISTGSEVSSVVADLRGGDDGPVLLLRADMDALPMPEDTGLEFASTVNGSMHACGHDAHVAMLVGAARILAGRRDSLAGSIRFAFQPGEEGFAGARYMIDEGVLENPDVDAAFALHVAPNLPSGSLWTKGGPLMASADVLDIRDRRQGRARVDSAPRARSRPGRGRDHPGVASTRDPAGRRVRPRSRHDRIHPRRHDNQRDPRRRHHAGHGAGGVEVESPPRARRASNASSPGSRAAHDMTATLTIEPGYPPTVNDEGFAGFALAVAADLLGAANTGRMPAPVMGAEDFSYVLEQTPGALAFLGVCPPGVRPAQAHSCHSNRMLLDEDAMRAGIALHCAVAERYLATGGDFA